MTDSPTVENSWVVAVGKKMRPMIDRAVAGSSDIPNDPVLTETEFPFADMLRQNWSAIRDEALEVCANPEEIPALDEISPDHRGIALDGQWRSFFLFGYGYPVEENLARCPKTAALVSQIPDLNSAFFSILKPGTHIPQHRGVTKGLVTCHLGLSVPKQGDCRMRVDDQIVRWAEGEFLVFDDTYNHEVWNDTDETRIILLIQVKRPAHFPGKLIGDMFLWGIKHTRFVQDARANIANWDAGVRGIEAARNRD